MHHSLTLKHTWPRLTLYCGPPWRPRGSTHRTEAHQSQRLPSSGKVQGQSIQVTRKAGLGGHFPPHVNSNPGINNQGAGMSNVKDEMIWEQLFAQSITYPHTNTRPRGVMPGWTLKGSLLNTFKYRPTHQHQTTSVFDDDGKGIVCCNSSYKERKKLLLTVVDFCQKKKRGGKCLSYYTIVVYGLQDYRT